jgi:FAD/FMN-containing dehydrogenase
MRAEGGSLRVYPTSAPRSTVGGWLARDGLGVGSYQYGWLSENVDSIETVLPGGARRVAEGSELGLIVGAEGATGIIVGATLRLREAGQDQPFAAAFDAPAGPGRAIESLAAERPPLWHLGLAHPALALSDGPERGYLIFGTYSGGIEGAVERAVSGHGGRMLSSAEAYRAWGARFFPAGLTGDLPSPAQAVVPVPGLEDALLRLGRLHTLRSRRLSPAGAKRCSRVSGSGTADAPKHPARRTGKRCSGSLRIRVGVSTSSVSSASRTPRGAMSCCGSKMR